LYQPNEHREFAFRYGQDVGATALCYLAWVLWHNGFLAQATRTADRAIRHAREFGHAHTLVYTLWHAAMVSLFARDAVRVATLANEVVGISAEHGFAMWLAYGNIIAGWATARRGEAAAGIGRMRAGIAAAAATGARLFEPLFLGLLAEGLVLDGSAAEAFAQLDARRSRNRSDWQRRSPCRPSSVARHSAAKPWGGKRRWSGSGIHAGHRRGSPPRQPVL
jgi:predicted ATPase